MQIRRYPLILHLIVLVTDNETTTPSSEWRRCAHQTDYFTYKDNNIQLEELAGGTGYADIVYLPKRNSDYPALVIELKALDKNTQRTMPKVRSHKSKPSLFRYSPELYKRNTIIVMDTNNDNPERSRRVQPGVSPKDATQGNR